MTKLKLIVGGLALLAAFGAGWTINGWRADKTIAEMTAAAERQARAAYAAVLEKERSAREKADELEVAYHDQTKNINLLAADNRRLADELGGLRDPYAAAGGRNQGNAPGHTQNAPAPGQLSREASKFLLDLAREADEMSAYAQTCYFWINRNTPGAVGPRPPQGPGAPGPPDSTDLPAPGAVGASNLANNLPATATKPGAGTLSAGMGPGLSPGGTSSAGMAVAPATGNAAK